MSFEFEYQFWTWLGRLFAWIVIPTIVLICFYHKYLEWHCPGNTRVQTTMKVFGYFEECRK